MFFKYFVVIIHLGSDAFIGSAGTSRACVRDINNSAEKIMILECIVFWVSGFCLFDCDCWVLAFDRRYLMCHRCPFYAPAR